MNADELSNEILEDTIDHGNNGSLPQFLNVLTILTFIGSGLTFVMAIYNLLTVEQQRQQIAETKALLGNSPIFMGTDIMKSAELALEHNTSLQGSAILASLACLVGAYMMRKLQKNGFYLYIAGCVVATIVPILIMGAGFMGGLPVIIGLIFTMAFVIMYGVNAKYLK